MIHVKPIEHHPATGYAIHIWRDGARLCTVYGGYPEETEARAGVVVTAFQNPGFELQALDLDEQTAREITDFGIRCGALEVVK